MMVMMVVMMVMMVVVMVVVMVMMMMMNTPRPPHYTMRDRTKLRSLDNTPGEWR